MNFPLLSAAGFILRTILLLFYFTIPVAPAFYKRAPVKRFKHQPISKLQSPEKLASKALVIYQLLTNSQLVYIVSG